jgi:hypothetical protein
MAWVVSAVGVFGAVAVGGRSSSPLGSTSAAAATKPSKASSNTTGQATPSAASKTKATTAGKSVANKSATSKSATSTSAVTSPPTSWKVLSVSAKKLSEVSGCAFSRRDPNRVWLHNDSGDGPSVIPVDISSGAVGTSVTLSGVEVSDPEDIAMTASGELILADIGDNAEARDSIQLYRFTEPTAQATKAEAKRFDLTYPDGPHNAEALVATTDGTRAYIVTKNSSGVASVFEANLADESKTQVVTKIGQVTIGEELLPLKPNQISAADTVGSRVILRSYQYGYVLSPPPGGKLSDAFAATPQRFDVPLMVQGEALCVSPDGQSLVTASESRGASTFALAVGPVPR